MERTGHLPDFNAIIHPVIVGVAIAGIGAIAVLLVEVGFAVAIAIQLAVHHHPAEGILIARIETGPVFVEIGQPIAIGILTAIGRAQVAEIGQFPPIRQFIVIGIDIEDIQVALRNPGDRPGRRNRQPVIPAAQPIGGEAGRIILNLPDDDAGGVGSPARSDRRETRRVITGAVIEAIIGDQTALIPRQHQVPIGLNVTGFGKQGPDPNLIDFARKPVADHGRNNARLFGRRPVSGDVLGGHQRSIEHQVQLLFGIIVQRGQMRPLQGGNGLSDSDQQVFAGISSNETDKADIRLTEGVNTELVIDSLGADRPPQDHPAIQFVRRRTDPRLERPTVFQGKPGMIGNPQGIVRAVQHDGP